jgi:DNA-binding TFAR19-related protein (PDSD5 family)
MSDRELEAIKKRKLREIQRRWAARQQEKTEKKEKVDPNEVLNRIFQGRAWEVFNAANHQFPNVTSKIKDILVELASTGRLKEVTGEQLYLFLRKMGLRLRLDTKIRYTEHGKLKSLADKIKEDLEKT